jgi:formylglycine-generating enzyme required for sulfatase activity
MRSSRVPISVILCGLVSFLLSAVGRASGEMPASIVGRDGAPMALVAAGDFKMGSTDEDLKALAPRHEVYLDAYYVDAYEVTNGLFARFLRETLNQAADEPRRYNWVVLRSDIDYPDRTGWWPTEIMLEESGYQAFPGYEDLPVNSVAWDAAAEYCAWAGKRLPTEAEWEKAARGGLQEKAYPWGDSLPTVGVVFNRLWRDNQVPSPTVEVRSMMPNGYGLYHMAGNVWEWCSDWYGDAYYGQSPSTNPKGPTTGEAKVIRGGSWYNSARALRVAHRSQSRPEIMNDAVGFRCAMDAARGDVGGPIHGERDSAP